MYVVLCDIPIRVIGRFGSRRVSVNASDWLNGCAVLFISVGGVRIGYIRSAVCIRQEGDKVAFIDGGFTA